MFITTMIVLGYLAICAISLAISTRAGWAAWKAYLQGALSILGAYGLDALIGSKLYTESPGANFLSFGIGVLGMIALVIVSIARMVAAHRAAPMA
jgi:hypothetical protein